MKYLIGIIVVIGILAYLLHRRGATGLGGSGDTETVEKSLGQSHRPGAGGPGGGWSGGGS